MAFDTERREFMRNTGLLIVQPPLPADCPKWPRPQQTKELHR
jgi:hypothetical protein